MLTDKIPHSKLSIDPILQSLSPDPKFKWGSLTKNENLVMNKNDAGIKNPPEKILHVLPVSSELISDLGLKVLSNRRVCIAERMLTGILMPKNPVLQSILLKKFLIWYLPCMAIDRNTSFMVNEKCFAEREKGFLKVYIFSLLLDK